MALIWPCAQALPVVVELDIVQERHERDKEFIVKAKERSGRYEHNSFYPYSSMSVFVSWNFLTTNDGKTRVDLIG